MDEWIKDHRDGFPFGYTTITTAGEETCDTGINFGILKLRKGEEWELVSKEEMAFLLLDGELTATVGDFDVTHERNSLFDDGPFSWHVPIRTKIHLLAERDLELAVFGTPNEAHFPAAFHLPESVGNERRGAGQVDGACLRWVRTIFDDTNTDPNCQLVLGEVVNMPGKWSSYPPHHHPQPEIYHYRFSDPRGFGHAELGDDVLKVRSYDTVKILDEKDHAQCSAPGYGMYYIWAIRHLPNKRYTVPEFTGEHKWTMEENAEFWLPKAEALV